MEITAQATEYFTTYKIGCLWKLLLINTIWQL